MDLNPYLTFNVRHPVDDQLRVDRTELNHYLAGIFSVEVLR